MKKYYSNGKLLISGEYVVLDGACSLAVPTKFGQSLIIEPIDTPKIIWESIDEKNNIWFKDEFLIKNFSSLKSQSDETSKRLIDIFKTINRLNPNHFKLDTGFKIKTELGFPNNWGLGTSSTLINNVADWSNVNPYELLKETFGGSGYDIACAKHNTSITYQLQNNNPIINTVHFNPDFKEHLYFVHLNKKQNSRDGIQNYKANRQNLSKAITDINTITSKLIDCKNLTNFETLLNQHEEIIAQVTQQKVVKEKLFSDYKGAIKSLGAWGGDFILATSLNNPTSYFKAKGFETILNYNEMVFQ